MDAELVFLFLILQLGGYLVVQDARRIVFQFLCLEGVLTLVVSQLDLLLVQSSDHLRVGIGHVTAQV